MIDMVFDVGGMILVINNMNIVMVRRLVMINEMCLLELGGR